MKKRYTVVIFSAIVCLLITSIFFQVAMNAALSSTSSQQNTKIENTKETQLTSASSPYISLSTPPAQALSAPGDPNDPNYGVPINTTNIGLFCYYNESTGWILNQTVTAFVYYTDYGNYYDAQVQVWQEMTGSSYEGSDFCTTVNVRVRTDGWIMAFINRTYDKANIPYWGATRATYYGGSPIANATSLARAIQRVYSAASKTFPGYVAFSYYDFERPTATKLLMFGSWITHGSYDFTSDTLCYVTIPATISLLYAYGTMGGGCYNYGLTATLKYAVGAGSYTDILTLTRSGNGPVGWSGASFSLSATSTKITFDLYTYDAHGVVYTLIFWLA